MRSLSKKDREIIASRQAEWLTQSATIHPSLNTVRPQKRPHSATSSDNKAITATFNDAKERVRALEALFNKGLAGPGDHTLLVEAKHRLACIEACYVRTKKTGTSNPFPNTYDAIHRAAFNKPS